ncbi:MAG TPA: hypothetical protein VMU95_41175 [Trebonia sp.]|nr:hypothetical protein [Trebonia sp.]
MSVRGPGRFIPSTDAMLRIALAALVLCFVASTVYHIATGR